MPALHRAAWQCGWPIAFASAALLAGCASPGRMAPSPAPALQLLSASPLEIPRDCQPDSGRIYRTRFVVQADGHVTDPASDAGDGCIADALRRWVASFRYGPLAASTPTAIDWMCVTAAKGS